MTGTKNVGKLLKKISVGLVKAKGKTWFPELNDKRKFTVQDLCGDVTLGVLQLGRSIKIHLYWAMTNCGGSAEVLKQLIMSIPGHYQVDYSGCFVHSTVHIVCCVGRSHRLLHEVSVPW